MRCHVPFAHRVRGRRDRAPGPVYIGFEQPVSIQRRRGRFNWAGFGGLMLALISPLTLFLIAPFALLLSLIGMRRRPRGMATVGLLLSLGATTILSLIIIGTVGDQVDRHHRREAQMAAARNRPLVEQTRKTLGELQDELREFRDAHSNILPDLNEGMMIAVQYRDAWERELFYEPGEKGCVIRSAGADGKFRTQDDVTAELAGIPDPGPLAGELQQ